MCFNGSYVLVLILVALHYLQNFFLMNKPLMIQCSIRFVLDAVLYKTYLNRIHEKNSGRCGRWIERS